MQFGFCGSRIVRHPASSGRRTTAFFGLALTSLVLFSAPAAYADCSPTLRINEVSVSFPPTINVPTTLGVGAVVATLSAPVPGAAAGLNYATCSGGGSLYWAMARGPLVANRVGTTSVQGIGYTSSVWAGGLIGYAVMDTQMNSSSVYGGPDAPTFQSQLYLTVNLIKTGNVVPGPLLLNSFGTGSPNVVGSFFVGDQGDAVFWVTIPPGASSITTSSCSVTTPTPNVVLPTVSTSAFQGVGTTAGATSFAIGLDCPTPNVRVFITLTDNAAPTNTSNMLSLRQDSTAQGIKLQILNANTPVSFGPDSAAVGNTNQWLAGTSAGGPMNVPLSARYIQAASPVRSGTVNGIATFTMSYQ